MEDNTTKHTYNFLITPLSIVHRTVRQPPPKNTMVVKLGNRAKKYTKLNTSQTITTQVIYSVNLDKFYPLKGIVKIYQLMPNGSQSIVSVGAFQADELLNSRMQELVIEKQIGMSIVTLKICVEEKIEDVPHEQMYLTTEKKQKTAESSRNRVKSSNSLKLDNQIKVHITEAEDPFQTHNPSLMSSHQGRKKQTQSFRKLKEDELGRRLFQETGSNMNISVSSNLSVSCQQLFDQYQRRQIDVLGQELIDERRKNRMMQENLEKMNTKVQVLRKKCRAFEKFNRKCKSQYECFIKSLQVDAKGQYIFQLNERSHTLTFHYNKKQRGFEKVFLNFISFIADQIKYKSMINGAKLDVQGIDEVLSKIEGFYKQKTQLLSQNIEKEAEIKNLKQVINQQTAKIHEKQLLISQKNQQIAIKQKSFADMKKKLKGLEDINNYWTQKDKKLEQAIENKNHSIQELKKMLDNINVQFYSNEQDREKSRKEIENLEMIIQELKEQIAIKNEMLQRFAQRFGFGVNKNTKKQDIQNEINDYLAWIDQENHLPDELSVDLDSNVEAFLSKQNSEHEKSQDENQ